LFFAGLAAATVTITAPTSGSTDASPTHFVASATSSHATTHFNVYVDGNKVYGGDVSKLDAYISVADGGHKAVVKAWDSTGASQSASVSFSVGSSSSTTTKTTFSHIEEKTGWKWCSGCANSGGGAIMEMVQGIASPTLDGSAARFFDGGTIPWSHALYYKVLSSNGTATNFSYTVHYYYKNPSAPSGMEYSISQRKGYQWYRWDTQCSYLLGNWRLWDNANARWYNTAIACPRPTAYKWTTVTFEGQRANGQVVFVAITIDGTRHYLNKAFGPKQMTSSVSDVKIHFQLNGNSTQTDYYVWGDEFTAQYW
jgi:hypothetical protein